MWFKTLVRKYKENVFAKSTGNFFEETDVPVLYPVNKKFVEFTERNKSQYCFAFIYIDVTKERKRFKISTSKSPKNWSKEENQILIDFYENPERLFELLPNRTVRQIRSKCERLNLPFSYRPIGYGCRKKKREAPV